MISNSLVYRANPATLLLLAFVVTGCGLSRSPSERVPPAGALRLVAVGGESVEIDVAPVAEGRLSSPFGDMRRARGGGQRLHQGIDYAAPKGTAIYAAADGCVATLRSGAGYGRYIVLRHIPGVETLYAHLSGFGRGLSAGQCVEAGNLLGYIGASGNATGPHLHFEVQVNGRAIDPLALPR